MFDDLGYVGIMIIWFALSIPILAAPILYLGFKHRIVWWELIIPVAVCLLFITIMKVTIDTCLTDDVEFWTGYITQARYQEQWKEEYDTYVPPTYDSKGHQTGGGYWVHHVDHHPPYWDMQDNNGIRRSISEDYYQHLVKLWNNHHHKDVFHFNQTSIGDGGLNWTDWNRSRETMVVLTTTHHYTNRIQASHSVFKFLKIENKTDLFDYPKIGDEINVPSVLGAEGDSANRFLCTRNAELGAAKQIRMWILVFNNKPLQAAIDQESYWMGGNKNELVACIGTNGKKEVKWCYVFSWSESEHLKIDIRQFILSQSKLDLMAVAQYMGNEANKQFVRKPFKDFDYLTIEPPAWSIWATYIVTLLITVGCSTWAVIADLGEQQEIYG